MVILAKYLTAQILPWLAISLGGSVLVFLSTQLLRVAPVFAGAGAGSLEMLSALGLLLVPVCGWALTPAFAVAVFAAAGRMSADGELTAVDASGRGRLVLMAGPVMLTLVAAMVSGWLWLEAAPRSQKSLRGLALELAGRAMVGRINAGGFIEPVPGLTFYAEGGGEQGVFKSVLIDDAREEGRTVQLVATEARLRIERSRRALEVMLGPGNAFYSRPGDAALPAALSFNRFDLEIPLAIELERRLDFLPEVLAVSTGRLMEPPPSGVGAGDWSFAFWRRAAGPTGFMALSLLSIVFAFGVTWRSRGAAVALAAAIFLAFHLMGRLGESLMHSGHLTPPVAAFLPSVFAFAVLGTLVFRQRLSALFFTG